MTAVVTFLLIVDASRVKEVFSVQKSGYRTTMIYKLLCVLLLVSNVTGITVIETTSQKPSLQETSQPIPSQKTSSQDIPALKSTSQFFPEAGGCKLTTNIASHLDLAIQVIKNVRDSNCICDSKATLPADCEDVLKRGFTSSGVYKVLPHSRVVQNEIEVYCDMDTDDGGWTVIQRRGNFQRAPDYFFKDWDSYKKGFGNIDKDFWLGNDNIYALTNQKLYSVRFDLKDVEGKQAHAVYDTFWIDDENQKYTLHIDGYKGDAGDSMTKMHNGMKFTTKDQKNDNEPSEDNSCALKYKGGWWYNKCHKSNLNGLYHRGKHSSFADGVNWSSWKNYNESLDWTEIKIRRKDFRP